MGRFDGEAWSPVEVEQRMQQVVEKLEDAVAVYKALGEAAAQAKRDHEVEAAKMLLLSLSQPLLKTDTMRKAWVTQQVGDLKMADDIAKCQFTAQSKVLDALHAEGDLLRSMNRGMRDLMDKPAYGGRG